MKKKSSENDQLTGHFQSSFIHFQSFFFSSPDPKSEKNPVNQLIKIFWHKQFRLRLLWVFTEILVTIYINKTGGWILIEGTGTCQARLCGLWASS